MTTLPPGQFDLGRLPRFGLTRFARRFPRELDGARLHVTGEVERELELPVSLDGLPRVEQTSDFHCVTTWSCRNLRWGGVRFATFWTRVVMPDARPRTDTAWLLLRGQDGARACLHLDDALGDDVLLADRLDGEPLSVAHGAPLRLVAPAHYGYKSCKYLERIELRRDLATYRPPAFRFMDHPRARVALEERGGLPGRFLRRLYRPLVRRTIRHYERHPPPDSGVRS